MDFRHLPLPLLWLPEAGGCSATKALEELLELPSVTPKTLNAHFELLDDRGQALPTDVLTWSRAARGEELDFRCFFVDRRDGRRTRIRVRTRSSSEGRLLVFDSLDDDPELIRTTSLMGEAAVALLKARGRGSMASAIATVLARALVAELVLVHCVSPEGGELELLARVGLEGEPLDEWLALPLSGSSVPAWVAERRGVVELETWSTSGANDSLGRLRELGMASVTAVALRQESRLVGTVLVARGQRGRLNLTESRMLEAVSAAASAWLAQQRALSEGDRAGGQVLRRAVMETVLELCPAGVLIFSAPEGELLAMNRRARELFADTLEEVSTAGGAWSEPLGRALLGESVRRESFPLRSAGGPPSHLRLTALPARAGAEPVAVVAWVELTDSEALASG